MGNFRRGTQGGFNSDRRSSFGGRRSFDRREDDSGGRGGFGRGRDDRGEGRGFGDRRERRPLEMFKAVCDKCKKECEVPFKPTQGKPIYCKECFDVVKPIPSQGISGEQIAQITEKLDKIMKALHIDS